MARTFLPAAHGVAERFLPGGDVLRSDLRVKAARAARCIGFEPSDPSWPMRLRPA
jgi:hypothetical protein